MPQGGGLCLWPTYGARRHVCQAAELQDSAGGISCQKNSDWFLHMCLSITGLTLAVYLMRCAPQQPPAAWTPCSAAQPGGQRNLRVPVHRWLSAHLLLYTVVSGGVATRVSLAHTWSPLTLTLLLSKKGSPASAPVWVLSVARNS
jgi:hypothetical protein